MTHPETENAHVFLSHFELARVEDAAFVSTELEISGTLEEGSFDAVTPEQRVVNTTTPRWHVPISSLGLVGYAFKN